MKIIKHVCTIFYWLVLATLVLIAALVGISVLNIPGNIKLYTVQSGSMEPYIHTGSIVITKPNTTYQKGDVITFKEEKDRTILNPKTTVTHRIVEVKSINGVEEYITKGDANSSPDMLSTDKGLVLGKELFSIPLLGYPVAFAKTRDGLILIVVIPATLIVYGEFMNIKNEATKLLKERKKT